MVVYPLELPWQLLQEISEDCKLVTVINRRKASSITIDEIKTEYTNNGVTISNCEFIIANNETLQDGINSHWIRDFGPWCIFNGKDVAIVDNVYNRSFVDDNSNPISSPSWTNGRWRDDKFARTYATDNSIPLYGMEVVHTGGNMMQDGRGVGVSDLIVHTQSETFAGISKETVNQRMNDYLGIDTYHVTIDPQGDYIAHVDCWGKFLAPDKIIIARVPGTHEQYSAYEEVATYFENTNCCWGYPYKVYRVDVPVNNKSQIKDSDKIAPYTNSLIINNKVLVPINPNTSSTYNENALAVYREAMPGYEIVGINYTEWKNTDALHCRTRDIMDFNMLFVDHRNVLFGKQVYQESYPITAKFIAYSGDNITETKLHYSIDGGNSYTTVNMQQVGTTDEYTANITGHTNGATIKYYVTGKDASNRTCIQPQFGELEPHTFTVGEASGEEPETPVNPEPEPEQPAQPVLDITKYYRIKTVSGTGYQYLTIFDHTSNPLGGYGGVGVAMLDEDNAGQMFKFEDAGEGKYYLISADGYYIYCQSWNVDAIDGTQKSALWGFDSENEFELQCDKGYFKVENVNGNNYVFCNVSKETRATIATWGLEEVPVSVTISAASTTVTVNESVQFNATAIGGTGNYTYSWSPATSFADATIANPTFTSATADTCDISCTVTDNGVTATSNTVTIKVNEAQQSGTGSEVVTIGDVTASTTSSMIPIYTYYSKSISQSYYLEDEIGKDKGTISNIAFHTATGDFPCKRTISIYMKNTDASSFADKNMIAMENGDLVFNGSVVFASNQWVTIDLDTDFSYNGNNILLCVYDETGSYIDYADFKTFADNSDTRTRYQYGNASSDFSPIGKQISGRTSIYAVPCIQLTFGDGTTQEPDPITISANPSKVVVGDEINFTVVQGSTNATTSAKFYIGDDEISNPYTTTSAGTFTVRAEKDGQTAETTFTVVEPNPINLYVNPSEVLVGKNIKFTVTQVDINGTEQDVTNDSRFYIEETNTEVLSTYTTETAGTFTVRAEKDGLTATKTFTVVNPIILTATPSTVTVGEEIKFTVMQGDNDVTSEATLYIGATIISNPYTTTNAGTYTVYAQKGTLTSNEITITAKAEQSGDDTSGDVVTIGKDGTTESQTYPYISTIKYSSSQQIYTSTEIGKSGTLSKIAFYLSVANVNKIVNNVKIYIKHTSKSSFVSRTDWDTSVTSEHLVYDGNPNITNSVLEIPLDPYFKYNGTDNLLICVDVNSIQDAATWYKTYNAGAARVMYCRDANYNYGPDCDNYYKQAFSNPATNIPVISLTFSTGDTSKPTISVDKPRFTADNSDYVKFTVTPEDAEIWWSTTGTQNAVQLTTTDKSFKTSNAGTYSFYAMKDGVSSDPITVEAVAEKELTLTLSKNSIVANGIDEVTFTVKQVDVNGTEKDVTNKCTFKINGTAITGNTFFTNRAGTYTVTATKNSKEASIQITATAVSGEENVVLIDGNVMQPAVNTSNLTVPVCNYDKYGISQQYYKASEIGKNENGIISHISFKTAKNSGTYSRNIKIYMVNTDESDFGETGRTTKQMSEDNDLVFSGSVNFTPNTWVTIELTNKFTYTANKNILVCVNDITSNNVTPISSYFDTYEKDNYFRTLYKSNTEAFDPTAEITNCSRVNFTPFIKFTFEKEDPITIVANKDKFIADGSDKVTFSVTQGSVGTGKDVTDQCSIFVNGEELNDVTYFKTTQAGTYTVYATKGDLTSEEITITAIDPIMLTVDKTNILADGKEKVTFTVMQGETDVTEDVTITYYFNEDTDNNVTLSGNSFNTTTAGYYFFKATYVVDGLTLETTEIQISATFEQLEEDNGECFADGSITYNIGEDNEYTLRAVLNDPLDPSKGCYIKQDNVNKYGNGIGLTVEQKNNPDKPKATTILTIPKEIKFRTTYVTVTKIEDFAFDETFYYDSWNYYNEGHELNTNFTGIIIPGTIREMGSNTFAFTMEEKIVCYAPVPPTIISSEGGTLTPPFIRDTYDNIILYVPVNCLDAYKNAPGWGVPINSKYPNHYFKNIYPIETPTFIGEGDWEEMSNWDPTYGFPEEGEDVLINGDATIEDETIANVGAIHIISGSGSITIADGGQLIHTNAGVNVTLEKEIIGYHESTSPTSWYTISSPLFNSVKASSVENLLSNDYDLYRYDEPTHYWDNIEDPEGLGGGPVGAWETLDAGRGYLYANSGDVTLQFNGVANHTSASYTLTRGTEDGKLEGFHLVGNPFTHDIYMNNAFDTEATLADGYYILSNTGAWGANLGSNTPIEPCQGVLIKALTEGTLTINKNVGNVVTRSRANNKFVTISIANNKYEDVAYVSFDAKNPLEKVSHHNNNIPMVYIPTEEAIYAIATMEDDVKEIPVAFEAKTMGQYTISVKAKNCEFESMNLVDRKTGEETNLLLEDYTFLATTTDNSERFIIRLNDNISDNEDFIFINNGEIIINKIEGKGVLQIFDVMGRYISHSEVSGSANISTEAFTNGVYIIRMTDDNGVKTQKVVL